MPSSSPSSSTAAALGAAEVTWRTEGIVHHGWWRHDDNGGDRRRHRSAEPIRPWSHASGKVARRDRLSAGSTTCPRSTQLGRFPNVVEPERRVVRLHGHRIVCRIGGGEPRAGRPVLVLIHGIAGSSATWEAVLPALARRYTVVAPDLLGHGESDKPRHDYSLGAYANMVRDVMIALGIDRATIVGHSFGGGVAMQFAYQHPSRCERLVLESSGGLGPEISWMFRALDRARRRVPHAGDLPVVRPRLPATPSAERTAPAGRSRPATSRRVGVPTPSSPRPRTAPPSSRRCAR